MKPHRIGGLLKNTPNLTCFIFIAFNDEQGDWFEVPKAMVRDVVTAAKEDDVVDVAARFDEAKGELFIGREALDEDDDGLPEGETNDEVEEETDEVEEEPEFP